MAAMQHGFYRLNMDDGSLEAVGDPESDLPDNRFNDGKCDPAGRFWAGTMSLKGEEGTGSLYMLDTEGKIHKKWGPVTTSNGLAWSRTAG